MPELSNTKIPPQNVMGCQIVVPEASGLNYPEQLTPITIQLRRSLEAAAQHLVEAGSLLLKAKEILAHGQFQIWLRDNFNMSSKTANRLMSIAKMVKKLELATDMVEKLVNLDLSVLYEISAKSTTEEVQRQVFDEIAQNHPISYEMVRLIKKKMGLKQQSQSLKEAINQEKDFLQFVRVLRQFSTWFDQHQPQLYSRQIEIQVELKQELETYAQKLKAASDVVSEILEQTCAQPYEVVIVLPQTSPNQDPSFSSPV